MNIKFIRNFCIIAHIDHGKSTLADRMLEITQTVKKREMKEQLLDQMDLERERGITIKLAPVRMDYKGNILNLIDTPGHVDFSYEVSRSLAAVEGVILLVDATQGIEAQTLSTLYSALEHNLTIIPVINKIDLPQARMDETSEEIVKLLGCKKEEILQTSAKTGEGVSDLLNIIVKRIPPPKNESNTKTKALIFDSIFDPYRGVIAYVRVVSGQINKGDNILLMQKKSKGEVLDVGYFKPKFLPHSPLSAGEIGYVVMGFKDVSEVLIGDTITNAKRSASSPLPGYKKVTPFVYASLFPSEGDKYPELSRALEKLKLNDSSLEYDSERSDMLGFGFRCGFLGLLHLDIVKERLEREFNLDLVVTSPTVIYQIKKNNTVINVTKVSDFSISSGDIVYEPWVEVEIITPQKYIGGVMELCRQKRAVYINTKHLENERVMLCYQMPLSELIIDFYDKLKSITKGYASLSYEMLDYKEAELEKVDILVAEKKAEALSFITHRALVESKSRHIVEKLKELVPRQNFEVKIQAAVGSRIIASARISPLRKDVTAKLYGGDVTRKRKLLEKQKKGKKKMKQLGEVQIPSDVFIKIHSQ